MALRSSIGLILLFVSSNLGAAIWEPPPHPDPGKILGEAQNDANQGKFKIALEKHIWFHENALQIDQSYYGVRLSFALAYWVLLAEKYTPALDELISISDREEARIQKSNECCSKAFHDFSSINEYLKRYEKVVSLFVWLDESKPTVAKANFKFAKKSLIVSKKYLLVNKYIDPESELASYRNLYETAMSTLEEKDLGDEIKVFMKEGFIIDASTLVAILTINGRQNEAQHIAIESQKVFQSPEFDRKLEKALSGVVPEQQL